jgi:hypothetical protein
MFTVTNLVSIIGQFELSHRCKLQPEHLGSVFDGQACVLMFGMPSRTSALVDGTA